MRPERFAAPLSIIETHSDEQRTCPYCRWGSHSLYRLDSWPDDHAGCASCVLYLLSSKDHLIHHSPGPAEPTTGVHLHAGVTSQQSQSEANTESRADG